MKKVTIIAMILLLLLISIVPVFGDSRVLGFDDDTIYVRVIKYRYDRAFPSSIEHTEYRSSGKYKGRLNLDYSSIRQENDNSYSAVYEGTCYFAGNANAYK
ncbi:hypothetical protein [Peptoniphilus raoultii]|uniref:hypothetical protein n=1 Tax=Peptoniphilus raoultii TaxID=1776387 RepID=UPI0008D94F39|nr:hypothetical protein [Peptoniphilus raoultii]